MEYNFLIVDKLDRRDFLKASLIGVGALVLRPERFAPGVPFTAELINGIEVYGTLETLKSKSDLQLLISSLEKKSFNEIPGSGGRIERTLLPADKRYWEFIVPESMYKRYQDAESTQIPFDRPRGVDFVSWAKFQAEKANEILENSYPPIPFRIELKRVFVLADSLYPNENPFWKPSRFGDNFARFAKDVDSRWAFGPDYYDYQFTSPDPLGKHWIEERLEEILFTKGYTEAMPNKDGVLTTVDWGLIHELFHHFDIGDLYWLPGQLPERNRLPERFKNYDFFPNDIMGYGSWSAAISPVSAYSILERIPKGVRGVQHEPLGNTADNQYVNFPAETYFQFNFPDATKVNIVSSMGANGLNPFKKDAYDSYNARFTQDASENGFDFAYLLIDMRKDGKRSTIPIPRFLMNMTKWVGQDKPKFQIMFTGNDYETAIGMKVSVVSPAKFAEMKENQFPLIFAWTEIPGTNSLCVWSQYLY